MSNVINRDVKEVASYVNKVRKICENLENLACAMKNKTQDVGQVWRDDVFVRIYTCVDELLKHINKYNYDCQDAIKKIKTINDILINGYINKK